MQIYEKLFLILVCCFEFYMLESFMDCVMEQNRRMEKYRGHVFAGAIAGLFITNLMYRSSANLFLSFGLYFLTVASLYQASIKNKLYILLIFTFILAAGEFLVSIVLMLLKVDINLTMNPFHIVTATCSAKLLSFLVLQYLMNRAEKQKDEDIPNAWAFYIFPVSSIVVYIAVYYLDVDFMNLTGRKIFLLAACLGLFLANIAYFIIFQKTVEYMRKINALEVYQTRSRLAEQHYERTKEYFTQSRKLRHDLLPLLNLMTSLVKDDKNEELLKLIEGVGGQVKEIGRSETEYCSSGIINALLSEKKEEARQKNVRYSVMVEPCYTMGDAAEYDIVGILHNVLDNAMEAASKCLDGEGFMSVQMFISEDEAYSVLRVENSFAEKPQYKNKFMKTSKREGDHGLGMAIINEKVSRYGGHLDFVVEEKSFCLTIILPLEQKLQLSTEK